MNAIFNSSYLPDTSFFNHKNFFTMKKLFLLAIAGALVFTGTRLIGQTGTKVGGDKGGSGTSERVTTRGEDPEIKVKERVNGDKSESKAVQPGDKGGQTRGSHCYVKFDNWTSYYVDCYIDGYHESSVAPSGDGSLTVIGGTTRLYAKAEFNDGSSVSWGPISRDCDFDHFEMEVHDGYYNYYIN